MKSFAAVLLALSLATVTASGQGKGFGLGVILGEPTGLSGKQWLTGSTAIDAAAAWRFGSNGYLMLHADYLYHNFNIIKVHEGRFPVYFGIGGVVGFGDKSVFGMRGVVGLNYHFSGAPLDVFLEAAPAFLLAPETDFSMFGGIGVRFFF